MRVSPVHVARVASSHHATPHYAGIVIRRREDVPQRLRGTEIMVSNHPPTRLRLGQHSQEGDTSYARFRARRFGWNSQGQEVIFSIQGSSWERVRPNRCFRPLFFANGKHLQCGGFYIVCAERFLPSRVNQTKPLQEQFQLWGCSRRPKISYLYSRLWDPRQKHVGRKSST